MSDKLITNIYDVTQNFRDPITDFKLDKDNKNINIVCKDGNVNISLNIDPNFQDKYQNLISNLKNSIQKLEGISSVNVVLLQKN